MAKAILKLAEMEEVVTGHRDEPVEGGKPGETKKVAVTELRNKIVKVDLPTGYPTPKEALNALVRGRGGVLEASLEGSETEHAEPAVSRRPPSQSSTERSRGQTEPRN